MLKKTLALLICVACIISSLSAVVAAEEALQTRIICSGDVEKINIEIIPAEPCTEPLGVYVIKDGVSYGDITPENVSDAIIAIKEIKAVDGVYSAILPLKDGVEAGWYRAVLTDYLYAAPDWNDTDIEERSARVYLADINLLERAVEALNGADRNTVNSLIEDEYNAVLNITFPSDYDEIKGEIAKYLILEREYTYGNTFESVDEIRAAYEVAVFYASLAASDDDMLKGLIGTYGAEVIEGFAEDFAEFEDEAIRIFVKIRDSRNTNVTPVEEFRIVLREATAVAALNKSSRADIGQIIENYNDILELDLDGKFEKVNETEVYKALSRMGFDSVEDVQKAFEKRIEELLDKKQTTGGGGGGGGGGSSFGGGSSEYKFTDNEMPETVKPSDSTFADMKQAEWAKEYVEYLVERKIVNGDGTGNFKPNARVTREEFIKMIVLAFGLYDEDAKADFDDVNENAWYYPYIASAVKNGIIRGVDERNFGVGANITRQDIAVIASRVYGINGKTVETTENAQQFADYDSIADYAKDSVMAMRDAGIINGFEDNTFMPADFATRAQSAKIIYVLTEEVLGL